MILSKLIGYQKENNIFLEGYKATIFLDGQYTTWEKNREVYIKEKRIVNAGETLKLHIASGGGVCIKLELK
ncbi:glycoside hydrolase family 97 C-terminal domain-containing protein [Polaribacter sp.]|uniref:glycoside hydrolase family 97 C-terminal domain-containing protein n=1 Tax=Polaribacter sp. TaxID=1920175 RepID=UPI003EF15854